ncbi:MAG: hypothetical protein ACK4OM_06380 [Alphaproteobacteria bacterium]
MSTVVIHGDYDPHPTIGVLEPLSKINKNFKYYDLKHCGHTPWKEKEAKDVFYNILKEEL